VHYLVTQSIAEIIWHRWQISEYGALG